MSSDENRPRDGAGDDDIHERTEWVKPATGLATVLVLVAIVAVSIGLFRGDFTKTVPLTVISNRAGLVMNPDAKVKMRGVQLGTVESIEALPGGRAAIHLAMNPDLLHFIPSNVYVDIASTTVFGSKYVQLTAPQEPSAQPVLPGQTLQGEHVTVEINTVFQQLVAVLSKINPAKLNQTLAAITSALSGRGEQIGQTAVDLNTLLAQLQPSLPALGHDLETAPQVLNAFADAAPDLARVARSVATINSSLVDTQGDLNALLVSLIGLANTGNEVLGDNRQGLSDVIHFLRPTTDLTNQYSAGINCALEGIYPLATSADLPEPGAVLSAGFTLGIDRYRYPSDLPKVAATGGVHCMGLPDLPFETAAPFLVTDTGTNPFKYGNQGIVLNTDAMKRFLFGPIDGPARNTSQIGQPG